MKASPLCSRASWSARASRRSFRGTRRVRAGLRARLATAYTDAKRDAPLRRARRRLCLNRKDRHDLLRVHPCNRARRHRGHGAAAQHDRRGERGHHREGGSGGHHRGAVRRSRDRPCRSVSGSRPGEPARAPVRLGQAHERRRRRRPHRQGGGQPAGQVVPAPHAQGACAAAAGQRRDHRALGGRSWVRRRGRARCHQRGEASGSAAGHVRRGGHGARRPRRGPVRARRVHAGRGARHRARLLLAQVRLGEAVRHGRRVRRRGGGRAGCAAHVARGCAGGLRRGTQAGPAHRRAHRERRGRARGPRGRRGHHRARRPAGRRADRAVQAQRSRARLVADLHRLACASVRGARSRQNAFHRGAEGERPHRVRGHRAGGEAGAGGGDPRRFGNRFVVPLHHPVRHVA